MYNNIPDYTLTTFGSRYVILGAIAEDMVEQGPIV